MNPNVSTQLSTIFQGVSKVNEIQILDQLADSQDPEDLFKRILPKAFHSVNPENSQRLAKRLKAFFFKHEGELNGKHVRKLHQLIRILLKIPDSDMSDELLAIKNRIVKYVRDIISRPSAQEPVNELQPELHFIPNNIWEIVNIYDLSGNIGRLTGISLEVNKKFVEGMHAFDIKHLAEEYLKAQSPEEEEYFIHRICLFLKYADQRKTQIFFDSCSNYFRIKKPHSYRAGRSLRQYRASEKEMDMLGKRISMLLGLLPEKVEFLDLSHCTWAKQIEVLSYDQLKYLALSDCQSLFLFAYDLIRIVQGCPNLRILNVSNFQIHFFSPEDLMNIATCCSCLEELNLSGNLLHEQQAGATIETLEAIKQTAPHLKKLILHPSWSCLDTTLQKKFPNADITFGNSKLTLEDAV